MEQQQARQWLQEAEGLQARVRAHRDWAWFPAVVFGLLVLGQFLLFFVVAHIGDAALKPYAAEMARGEWESRGLRAALAWNERLALLLVLYWLPALPLGYWVSAWYRRRLRARTGIGSRSLRPYMLASVLLLLLLVASVVWAGATFNVQYVGIVIALLILATRDRSRSLALVATLSAALALVSSAYALASELFFWAPLYSERCTSDILEEAICESSPNSLLLVGIPAALGVFLLAAGLFLRVRRGGGARAASDA